MYVHFQISWDVSTKSVQEQAYRRIDASEHVAYYILSEFLCSQLTSQYDDFRVLNDWFRARTSQIGSLSCQGLHHAFFFFSWNILGTKKKLLNAESQYNFFQGDAAVHLQRPLVNFQDPAIHFLATLRTISMNLGCAIFSSPVNRFRVQWVCDLG